MPIISKVAFVVDALPYIGGAEKVLMAALELFPDAPIYTLIYNQSAFKGTSIFTRQVIPSYLNKLPSAKVKYKYFLPLMPHAIAQFDLQSFDLILSFSYAVSHGIRTHPNQKHITYTYTPMRYAWRQTALNGVRGSKYSLANRIFLPFRKWDLSVIPRIDHFASVSHWISTWVKRVYQRDSTVIYPPINVERFSPNKRRQKYFTTVSRLVSHKRIDLLIGAFNQIKLPLVIIGEGPERDKLEQMAGHSIQFLGYLPDLVVADLLATSQAFV
jgi:glycosyltransferase involved in cell wall biosynthesis